LNFCFQTVTYRLALSYAEIFHSPQEKFIFQMKINYRIL